QKARQNPGAPVALLDEELRRGHGSDPERFLHVVAEEPTVLMIIAGGGNNNRMRSVRVPDAEGHGQVELLAPVRSRYRRISRYVDRLASLHAAGLDRLDLRHPFARYDLRRGDLGRRPRAAGREQDEEHGGERNNDISHKILVNKRTV